MYNEGYVTFLTICPLLHIYMFKVHNLQTLSSAHISFCNTTHCIIFLVMLKKLISCITVKFGQIGIYSLNSSSFSSLVFVGRRCRTDSVMLQLFLSSLSFVRKGDFHKCIPSRPSDYYFCPFAIIKYQE